jgi:NAD-dependent deacetylase
MANKQKKIVALTGAGISAESGITTFRDSGGLWEQYDVMDVASVDGWNRNAELVLRFYNDRRKQLGMVEPNAAHYILAELDEKYDVSIVTQNVDNLHERAGSAKVLHLHGELTKARSSANPDIIVDIGYRPIGQDERAPDGSRLRPHIVWFGEAVPMIEPAIEIIAAADILIIAGTSLNVYPAAGLVGHVGRHTPVFLIDPNEVVYPGHRVSLIREKATAGMHKFREMLENGLIPL